jgi:hypothetical protein
MADHEWRRRKVLRFTAARRERYLEVLGLTGNLKAAAEAIGFRTNRIAGMRKRDAAFDADCEAALEAASERLVEAEGPFEGIEDGEFQTIRIGRNGRAQIIAVGPGRWSKRVEDRFIELLAQSGNIEQSARAVGFAGTDMFRRRRQWPAFARRWDEALEEAEMTLEFRLVAWANNVGAAERERRAEERPLTTSAGSGQASLGTNRESTIPFNPEFALKFLKWREEKRRGGGQRGRAIKPHERSFEEAVDSILTKIDAIERHEKPQKLKQGWSEGENGYMIPPGWVRADDAPSR